MNTDDVVTLVHKGLPSGAALLAIDGLGGSGKSVLGAALADALGAQLVHVDDFYRPEGDEAPEGSGHGALFDLDRLRREVLEPLSRGREAALHRYDWESGQIVPGSVLAGGRLTIVEGVYSTRRDLRRYYDFSVWVDASETTRLRRGVERDGEEARGEWVDVWMPAERAYCADEQPAAHADLRLDADLDEGEPSYGLVGPGRGAGEVYHKWYYESGVWERTTWRGAVANKSVSDLWLYQELLCAHRPRAVIECGTGYGGSTLYFADVVSVLGLDCHVVSIDVSQDAVHDLVRHDPRVTLVHDSSTSESTEAMLTELRAQDGRPWFVILDSNHEAWHVEKELELFHRLGVSGDRIVVEDGNVGGRPVLPDFGPGPYEAVQAFLSTHGRYYDVDTASENKFGFTFAPGGFLVRR